MGDSGAVGSVRDVFAAIRKRYTPEEPGPCWVCGKPLDLHAEDWEERVWGHSEHYGPSRVITARGDERVLALLDLWEAALALPDEPLTLKGWDATCCTLCGALVGEDGKSVEHRKECPWLAFQEALAALRKGEEN